MSEKIAVTTISFLFFFISLMPVAFSHFHVHQLFGLMRNGRNNKKFL